MIWTLRSSTLYPKEMLYESNVARYRSITPSTRLRGSTYRRRGECGCGRAAAVRGRTRRADGLEGGEGRCGAVRGASGAGCGAWGAALRQEGRRAPGGPVSVRPRAAARVRGAPVAEDERARLPFDVAGVLVLGLHRRGFPEVARAAHRRPSRGAWRRRRAARWAPGRRLGPCVRT
ncbi:unnamed protein product [Pedinophyceae sp. YPF-701]|nr:unnamed protein product [Pedinophyceae sp. YPF-701]